MGVVAVAVAATVGLAAWWFATSDAPAGQPVASVAGAVLERDGTVEASSAARGSVALVHAEGCGVDRQATATLLRHDDGPVVLTNQHVVAGTSAVTAELDGDSVELAVLGRVDGRDVVELDAGRLLDAGAVPLEVGPRPVVGARVVVAGFPDGRFAAPSGVVRAVEVREGFGGRSDVLLVDVDAVPGISGGVLLDVAGRAVGLVVARDPVTHDVVSYPLDRIGPATEGSTVPCR